MKKLSIVLVSLVVFVCSIQSQPTAMFDYTAMGDCGSTTLSFIDESTSTEDIVTWEWDFGDGTTSTAQNPGHIYSQEGTYSVCLEVVDALSQSDQICEPLTISNDTIIFDNILVTDVDCFGENTGSIDVSVSGGGLPYTYLWSDGSTTEDVSGLSAGVYTLTVTGGSGCSVEQSITISQPNMLLINIIATCVTNGQDDGTLNAIVSGGIAPYTYEWSNGVSAPTTENLAAGIYEITVTDVAGCTATDEIDLAVGNIEAEIQGVFDYCLFDVMSICAEVTNSEPGDIYSYFWTGPNLFASTEQCISFDSLYAAMEGLYSVVITDVNGCDHVISQEISVTTTDEIIMSVGSEAPIVCEDEVFQLEVLTVGDPGNYTYEWSPSALLNDPTITNPEATIVATTWFEVVVTDLNGCTAISDGIQVFFDEDCMWPGDTDTNKVVNNLDLLNIGLGYDSTSVVRPNASLIWEAQANYDGSGNLSGINVNKKHIDCNGDGIINADDTLAVTLNWGEMHDFTGADDVQFSNSENPQDGMTLMAPFYVQPDTLIENESYALPIILGEEGAEAENVYGVGFTLEYDSSIIVVGSASVGYDGWLGAVNDDMLAIQKTFVSPGRIDVGMTRVDKVSMTGFGQLGILYITIEDDVLLRAGNDSRENGLEVVFNITNVRIIDSNGNEVPIVPMETTTTVESPLAANDINWNEYIQISPNPADDILFMTTKNIEIENIKIYSITGELLMSPNVENATREINVSSLNTGMYLLEVRTDLGVMVERVVVVR